MNFANKVDKTPQELWSELDDLGGRLLMTIPFGVDMEKARGFISINGDSDSLPILTICVENSLTERSTVTTIVFDSIDRYLDLITKIWSDKTVNFSEDDFIH